MARAITVAVVDDDRMLLDGLRVRLDGVPEVLLAATARTVDGLPGPAGADGPEAGPVPYDVVLLDPVLGDGPRPPDDIRRLRAAGARVLVIGTVADRRRIVAAITAGADGHLTEDHDLRLW